MSGGPSTQKTHPTYPIGGDIWMAAFAAWQYSEIVTTNKLSTPEQEEST